MKKTLLRVASMVMAIAMLVCSANLSVFAVGSTVSVGGSLTVADAEIVSSNYAFLSDLEKAVLASGALVGNTHSIVAPAEGDNLVTVDPENSSIDAKSITKNGYVWTPVSAVVKYQDVSSTNKTIDVTLTDGKGTFSCPSDNYSVDVLYQTTATIAEATQRELVNAPAYLADAIANMNAMLKLKGSLDGLASQLDPLVQVVNTGYTFNGTSAEISGKTKPAVLALDADRKANGGTFKLCTMLQAYSESANKVEYAITNGDAVKAEFDKIHGYLADLCDSNEALTTILNFASNPSMSQYFDANQISTLKFALNDVLKPMKADMDTIAARDWTVMAKAAGVVANANAALNTAVLATVDADNKSLVKYHDSEALTETLIAANTTLTSGVAQSKVNVIVEAYVIEQNNVGSKTTLKLTGKSATLLVKTGATKTDVIAKIAEAGLIADSLASWDAYYNIGETYYDLSYENLGDTLTADVDCTIKYTPKNYTVTFEYNSTNDTVPYGYNVLLEKHADDKFSYDYTVNGAPKYEGEVYRVVGDTTIDREEGAAVSGKPIAEAVANSTNLVDVLNAKEKAILSVDAFTFGNIFFRDPAKAGEIVTVTSLAGDSYSVTAPDVASGLPSGAAWKAVSADVIVDDAVVMSFAISGGSATFDYVGAFDRLDVNYEVAVSDITKADVDTIASLAHVLATDAEAQTARLDQLSSDSIMSGLSEAAANIGTLQLLKWGTEAEAAIARLVSECVNSKSSQFYLYEYMTQYKQDGLAYYYADDNSEKIIAQLDTLIEIFDDIVNDPTFDSLKTQFPQYADKLDKVDEVKLKLESIDLSSIKVNENIDRKSGYLKALADAVVAAIGSTSAHTVTGDLKFGTVSTAAAPDKTTITIRVDVLNGLGNTTETYSKNYSFANDTVLGAGEITTLEGILDTLVASVAADLNYYSVEGELPAVGTNVSTIKKPIVITYKPYVYTVKIDGEGDQTFTYDATWSVKLPACSIQNSRYEYSVAGEKISVTDTAHTYTFKNLSAFDANKTLEITREVIDLGKESLDTFVANLNDAFATGNMQAILIPVEDASGNISLVLRVAPSVTGVQASQMALKLVSALTQYSTVALAGTPLRDSNGIHIQAIVDMLAWSGFSFDSFCTVVDANGNVKNDATLGAMTPLIPVSGGIGGKMATSTLALDSAEYPFYVTMQDGVGTETLAKLRNALVKAKAYANLECANGVFSLDINSPDSAYPYYLAAMLVIDMAEISDPQDLKFKESLEYEFSLIKPVIMDDSFTIETLENTIAKAGKNVDLSEYEKIFNYALKAVRYLIDNTTITADNNQAVYSGKADVVVKSAIEAAMNKFGFDASMINIAEAQDGSSISFKFSVALKDTETTYDAIIFDYSKSGLGKLTCTTDLADALSKVGNNAVIVLMQDVVLTKSVTIANNAFINLNGHTLDLNGNTLTAAANVRITDATAGTENSGEVLGTLAGSFQITGGKYTADVSAMLPTGYSVNANGYVANDIYSVVANGNDYTIELSADFINSPAVPELKAVLVDVVFDIALNMYTTAAISVDGNNVYDFEMTDLVAMLDKSRNELANIAIDVIDVHGISAIVNAMIADVTDFGAIKTAIEGNTAVASYAIATKKWDVKPYVASGNYVTLDLVPADSDAGTLSIVIAGTDDNKAALAALCEKLDAIVTIDKAEINVNDISYNGGFNVDYSAAADITVDLSSDNDYAALVAAAVAYKLPAGAQKDAIVAALKVYFDNGGTADLVAALENVTAAQVIAAIKGLGAETCENMLTALGFTSDSVVALEAVYSTMIDLAAKVLVKFDITGPATTLAGFKVAGEFAKYNWTKDNVKNYNVDVALTLILASDKPAEDPVEIEDPTVDLKDVEVNKLIRGFYYDVAVNDVYIDALCTGITAEQLLKHVKFTITNATIEEIYVVDRNGNKCADDALVGTGYSVVVTASNSVSSETLTVRVIIAGDVNGNGKVDSGDAAMMARHYLGIELLNEAQILAADNNRNGKVDSGDAARIAAKYTYTWDDDTYESFYKA